MMLLMSLFMINTVNGNSVYAASSDIAMIKLYNMRIPMVGGIISSSYNYYSINTFAPGQSSDSAKFEVYDYDENGFTNGVLWGVDGQAVSNFKIVKGKKYSMSVVLKAKNGYTFKDSYSNSDLIAYRVLDEGFLYSTGTTSYQPGFVYANDNSSGKYCVFTITWNDAYEKVSSDAASLYDIPRPWADYSASVNKSVISFGDRSDLSIDSASWIDSKTGSEAAGKLEAGKTYTLKIGLKPASGYEWPDNIISSNYNETIRDAKFDGYDTIYEYNGSLDKIFYVKRDYICYKKASSLNAKIESEIFYPGSPVPAVTNIGDWWLEDEAAGIPEDETYGFTLDKTKGTNGVELRNYNDQIVSLTDGLVADRNDRSKNIYTLRIYATVKSGWRFDCKEFDINGDTCKGSISKSYGGSTKNAYIKSQNVYDGVTGKIWLERQFEINPLATKLEVQIDEPKVGADLKHTATISTDPSDYATAFYNTNDNIKKVQWIDTDTGAVATKAELGKTYLVSIYLRDYAENGKTFGSDFIEDGTILLNGYTVKKGGNPQIETVPKYSDNYYVYNITYTFPKLVQKLEKVNAKVKTPVVGVPVYSSIQAVETTPNNALNDRFKTMDISSLWEKSTDGITFEEVKKGEVFEGGYIYRVSLRQDIYNKFKTSSDLYLNFDVVDGLNNNSVDGVEIKVNDSLDSYYTFEKLAVPTESIEKAEVTGIVDKVYNGNDITQDITVKLGEEVLVKDTDYSVSYENNDKIGTATIIIKGIGKYKDQIKKTFEIKKEESTSENQGGNDSGQQGGNQDKPGENPAGNNDNKNEKTEKGVGTFSADGKILTDEDKVQYRVSAKLKKNELKKNLKIADKKSNGKYKITKLTKKGGKVTGGTVEYVAPYNKNTTLISATNKVKLGGVTFTVTSIAPNCAKGCKKLTKVVIGTNVTTIGKSAFAGCGKLKTITINSKKLKKVGAGAFKGISKKATISVPKNKKKAYTKLLKNKGQAKSVKIK